MIRRFLLAVSLASLFLSPLVAAAAPVKAPMKAMGTKAKTKATKSMPMPKGKMSAMKTGMESAMNGMSVTDAMTNNKKMEDMKKMKKMKQAMERKQRLNGGRSMQDMATGNKKSSMKKMSGDALAMAEDEGMSDEASMGTTMKKDVARMRRMLKMRRMRTAAALVKTKTVSPSAATSGGMEGETDEGMMD